MSNSSTSTSVLPIKIENKCKVGTIARFKEDFDEANAFCKIVEQFRDKAGIPAINEMRYAGYHLALSLDGSGAVADTDQLIKATNHAQRATYEAAEAGIQLALREINLFRKDYRKVVFVDIVKDWLDILALSVEAKSKLNVRRQTGDDQALDHVRHRQMFDYLSGAADRLDIARPEINKKMADARNKILQWAIGIGVAILLAMVALFRERILSAI